MPDDPRLFSEACVRNRDPILAVLREVLPASGLVLEVACGTGMHAAWFAAHLPHLTWQPTDPDPQSVRSAAAWTADLPQVRAPVQLDVTDPWPFTAVDAVYCANMIHISPWESAKALIAGAGRALRPGGPLVLYGPFRQADVPTAPSNEAFDQSLQRRDPRWGLRDLEAVDALARAAGFGPPNITPMPANNLTVVWRRT